jgi:hypothetical protein
LVGELNQIQAVGKLRFSSKRRIRLPFVGGFYILPFWEGF